MDAADAVRRAVETTRGVAREAGGRLEIGALPAPAPTLAEPDRLAQVFINLLSNALKYNDKDAPLITVSGRVEDGMLRFEVADNGPGVAARDVDRIFQKFSRGWDRTDTGGAGLGLAISRQIMRRFNGDLELTAAEGGPHGGAVFEVSIPLLAERAAAE